MNGIGVTADMSLPSPAAAAAAQHMPLVDPIDRVLAQSQPLATKPSVVVSQSATVQWREQRKQTLTRPHTLGLLKTRPQATPTPTHALARAMPLPAGAAPSPSAPPLPAAAARGGPKLGGAAAVGAFGAVAAVMAYQLMNPLQRDGTRPPTPPPPSSSAPFEGNAATDASALQQPLWLRRPRNANN